MTKKNTLHEVEIQDAERVGKLKNRPEREAWFSSLGLGMFIHWSVDSQLGCVISHSLVGSSQEYRDRYFNELPQTFCPDAFDPRQWARLARVCGMKYVFFTAKHHNGFCMWPTETTPFNVANTPYKKDITGEVVEAFRSEGIKVGFYFSPEDFWFLEQNNIRITRMLDEALPKNSAALREYNRTQLHELFTRYGHIDLAFFDCPDSTDAIRDVWDVDPNVMVTRGVIATPEQHIPEQGAPGVWEANFTLGTQWAFKPTNETYKSGRELIEMFIDIRAKGGNFLLNVGPEPNGPIPFEQERRLRELGLWNFINHESVEDVKPWHVVKENGCWMTQSTDESALYVFLPNTYGPDFKERKEHLFQSFKQAEGQELTVEILGHNGEDLEYYPRQDVTPRAHQTPEGVLLSVTRSHRIYGDRSWGNIYVAKVTGFAPAGDLDA